MLPEYRNKFVAAVQSSRLPISRLHAYADAMRVLHNDGLADSLKWIANSLEFSINEMNDAMAEDASERFGAIKASAAKQLSRLSTPDDNQ